MTNNEIGAFLRTQLLSMLAEQGLPLVDVTASFQPDNQGRLDGPVIYFVELSDEAYGAQSFETTTDVGTGQSTYSSTQRYRISYQLQVLAPVNKLDLAQPRAGDITKLALQLLKSPVFRAALKANNMGIERIPATKPNYVVNDRAQFEAGPMFEFTMSYKRSIIQKSAVITTADFAIHRV